jgi:hypothetical protein
MRWNNTAIPVASPFGPRQSLQPFCEFHLLFTVTPNPGCNPIGAGRRPLRQFPYPAAETPFCGGGILPCRALDTV